MNKKTREKGQTLLEVMIALSVAILVVSAVVIAVITSLSNEQFGVNQNRATHYAQEGLDIMRNVSESDWTTFSGYDKTNYCLSQNQTLTSLAPNPDCGPNVGSYSRSIKIDLRGCITPTPPAITNGKVTSTVSWSDGGCPGNNPYCHKVKLVSCYYKISNTFP